ncbi:Long-chain-fatty-acid--CoA ligase FadD13 [compost metagenome]
MPGIAEVAVVGRPDERWGEVPIAFVVVEAGAEITADAVMQICREKLAGFKCVKDVRFIQALPRSAVGKVLKRALLQQ